MRKRGLKRQTPPPAPVKKPPSLAEDLIYLLAKIGIIALALAMIFTLVFGLVPVTDADMSPQLKPGDLAMVYRIDKRYTQSDVIALEADGKTQLRRVIATGGDTVDMTAEGLVINGALQQELTPGQKTLPYQEGIAFPVTLAEDEIFVLGDDRDGAADSRVYGPVKKSDTLGKLMVLIRRRNF